MAKCTQSSHIGKGGLVPLQMGAILPISLLKKSPRPSLGMWLGRLAGRRMAGWQVGRLAGWHVGWLAGWLAGRLAGWQVGRLAGGRQAGRQAGR